MVTAWSSAFLKPFPLLGIVTAAREMQLATHLWAVSMATRHCTSFLAFGVLWTGLPWAR